VSFLRFTPVSDSPSLSGKAVPRGWGCHQAHPRSVHRVRTGVRGQALVQLWHSCSTIQAGTEGKRLSLTAASWETGQPLLRSLLFLTRLWYPEAGPQPRRLKAQELLGALQNLFHLFEQQGW